MQRCYGEIVQELGICIDFSPPKKENILDALEWLHFLQNEQILAKHISKLGSLGVDDKRCAGILLDLEEVI